MHNNPVLQVGKRNVPWEENLCTCFQTAKGAKRRSKEGFLFRCPLVSPSHFPLAQAFVCQASATFVSLLAPSAEPKALVGAVPKCYCKKLEMLSLIKSKSKKQDGPRSMGSANKILGGKRSKSLISKPIEVLTSANLQKLQQQQQQQNQVQNQQNLAEPLTTTTSTEDSQQLLLNSSGEPVLLSSAGGLSFGFTAMEISRPSSVMQQHPPERPSSRSSNSSRR